MAPLPAGQPPVPAPGDGTGPPAALRRLTARPARRLALHLLAAAAGLVAVWRLADFSGVTGYALVPRVAAVGLAAMGLFFLCGLGPARLLLPAGLRRHELAWMPAIGAVACALELTVLGYAGVPFGLALAVTVAGSAALGAWALWRTVPRPAAPSIMAWARGGGAARAAWPLYVAALAAAVALVPLLRSGFLTVIGEGSDAHMAAGTAAFLQDHHPLDVDPAAPLDQVPLQWRSKPPIYFPLAAVASLTGLETWEVLSITAAAVFAVALLGFFLVARELLGASLALAVAATALVALDRMVLHTVMHPYFNQTWGFMAMPFALVLGWQLVRGGSVHPPWRAGALLAAFLAVLAFAYPLALPIPLAAIVVWWWLDRRARRRAGLPVRSLSPRRLWHGPRSLLWMVPAALVVAVPVGGVLEKGSTAAELLLTGSSLRTWGGDLTAFFPAWQFFSVDSSLAFVVALPFIVAGSVLALRRLPRRLALGLLAVVAFGVLAAVYFRQREVGWYFHFKVLAFVAPLIVLLAAVGIGRVRWLGPVVLVAALLSARAGAVDELKVTFDQLPRSIVAVRELDADLPPGASVRLDMNPNVQIWANYLLAGQPTCSQRPLLGTQYPHVQRSRAADFALVDTGMRPPFDAAGGPVARYGQFTLYRLRPGLDLAHPERCSREMVQTVQRVQ